MSAEERARTVLVKNGIFTQLHAYDWVSSYELGLGIGAKEEKRLRKWMITLPADIKAAMRSFPPHCLVVARKQLKVPALGTIGCLVGFGDMGVLKVTQSPEDGVVADCLPGHLECVGYHGPYTPSWVKSVIGEGD